MSTASSSIPTSPELYYTTLFTPAGSFALAVDAEGTIVVTAFGGLGELKARAGGPVAAFVLSEEKTAAAREDIQAYFADCTHAFRSRLAEQGSPFQRQVWEALSSIPVGETRSYGQLAQELKSSPRAVGRANATNPVCLFVPCHRVIGANGSLTGYAFGEELKAKLLEHEGVKVQRTLRVSRPA